MLKIGDFSRLAHVTVKALRHYAEEGLLKPVWIDRFTGYRYYTLQQLPRLNRILALKELGFTLDEIRPMLESNLAVAHLREVMADKHHELEQRIRHEQARLTLLEGRILQIEMEGQLPRHEVVVKPVAALSVASIRRVAPSYEALPQAWDKACGEMAKWLQECSIRQAGPWMAIYHDAEYREKDIDLEMAVVVEDMGQRVLQALPEETVKVRRLPAVPEMACVLHPGGFETISQAYEALMGWVESNGYRVSGSTREIYHDEVVSGVRISRMVEVQAPVLRAQAAWQASGPGKKRKDVEMESKIVTLPAFLVVGLRYQGKNQNNEISGMWGKFNQRAGEIANPRLDAAYGLCFTLPDAKEGEFEYIAGFAVERVDRLPEGMVACMVPEQKYAVFTVPDLAQIGQTYQSIYQSGLAEAGLKLVKQPFDMEVYKEEFDPRTGKGIFYIYVAVE